MFAFFSNNIEAAGDPNFDISLAGFNFVGGLGVSIMIATLELRRDGVLARILDSGSGPATVTFVDEWAEGSPLGATFGDAYDIRATLDSGALSFGTTGSWLQMNTNRSWGVTQVGSGSQSADVTFEIRRRSDSALLYTSASISFSAAVL